MTLKITALQIHQWASSRKAQSSLPILIRRLITESLRSEDIDSKNFSSNVSRHGFDGTLVAKCNHPYIPKGESAWEMSVSAQITRKANRDFERRTHKAKSDSVFIFVTALNWPSKDKWLAGKQNSQWSEVRAYDANDLEQWLESSPATTLWLSEQIDKPQYHIQSPRVFLESWLNATNPVFPPDLILQDRDEVKSRISDFVKQSHGSSSSTVFADTSDEALAFICAALDFISAKSDFVTSFKAFVITEKQGIDELLPWQRGFEQPHILIVRTSNLASEIPSEITNRNLLLIAEARGSVSFNPADESYQFLPRISNFDALGKIREETRLLEKRTGGSLSALHRQQNCNSAKREPHWAKLSRSNRNFIWLALIGGWDERHEADKEIICEISGVTSFDDWREFTEPLLTGEDAPLFHTREDKPQYKLFSRIDAFLTISQKIRGSDIDHFLENIQKVYLANHPNYHLPEGTGSHFLQEQKYSDALRGGIMDGLAILAYYNERGALEYSDVSLKIKIFFDDIFADELAWRKLRDLLPKLAEVSPHDFIRHLKGTLSSSPEKIADLFPPREDLIWGFTHLHPPLLWALEGIAWNPNHLDSVLNLLCQLQQDYEDKITYNFMNRPSESMNSILRSWMPKTSANIDQRIKALYGVYKNYPDEGVKLALALAGEDRISDSTHMPIWRNDVFAKQIVTPTERLAIIIKAIDIVMDYLKNKNANRFEIACQAMDNFTWWGIEKAQEVTDVIRTIPADNDEHNRKLFDWAREWIERCSYYSKDVHDKRKFASMYKSLCDHFEPCDLTERYACLFSNSAKWEFYEEDKSRKKPRKIAKNSWGKALSKIYEQDGIPGLINLLNRVEAPDIVAVSLYTNYIAKGKFPKINEYLLALLNSDLDIWIKRLHLPFLFYGARTSEPMDASAVIAIIEPTLKCATDASKKALLLQTLRVDQSEGRTFIDEQSKDVKHQIFSYPWIAKGYELRPRGEDKMIPPESDWLVDYYLYYKRPRLALASFIVPEYIPIDKQFCILANMFISNYDVGGDKDPIPNSYHIECIFESLAKQYADADNETLAQLTEIEVKFHNLLIHSEHLKSSSFILRRLAGSPAYFVDLHKYVYKDEEGNIASDLNTPKENAKVYSDVASDVFYNLNLRHSLQFPWVSENCDLDAKKLQIWIKEVRQLAKEVKMSRIIDQHIGTGLSHSRLSYDDLRPEYTICDIMKNHGSPDMYEGFRLGRFNSRGVIVGDTDDMGFTSADLSRAYDIAADKLRSSYSDMAQVFDELSSSYRREATHMQVEGERRDMDFR